MDKNELELIAKEKEKEAKHFYCQYGIVDNGNLNPKEPKEKLMEYDTTTVKLSNSTTPIITI
jgi:hypothetical protein